MRAWKIGGGGVVIGVIEMNYCFRKCLLEALVSGAEIAARGRLLLGSRRVAGFPYQVIRPEGGHGTELMNSSVLDDGRKETTLTVGTKSPKGQTYRLCGLPPHAEDFPTNAALWDFDGHVG
jgi:hypothetical protein